MAPFVAATWNPLRSKGWPSFWPRVRSPEDPAFNDPELYAYRLPGTTWTLGATSSFAFNDRASLNVQYAHAFTNSPQNLKYRSNVVGLVYVHRF